MNTQPARPAPKAATAHAAISAHLAAHGTLPTALEVSRKASCSPRYARQALALARAGHLTPQAVAEAPSRPSYEPAPVITGGLAAQDHAALEADALARALAMQRGKTRPVNTITFERGPVCLVFVGDQHLGNSGTDYERVFGEAALIAQTPGMYAVTMGDLLDQFIIGRLAAVRFNAQLSIEDEWHLVRAYLRTLGPKLVAAVAGNHDGWAQALTGVDFMRDVIAQIRPGCVYDSDDARIHVKVGDSVTRLRIRHAWLGSSIHNPTHGIERAAKADHDFDIGVGAHTHTGGFSRDGVAGGRNVLAVQVGTYKRHDAFARRIGFAMSNPSTAVAVILHEDGTYQGCNSLAFAAEYMRLRYGQTA